MKLAKNIFKALYFILVVGFLMWFGWSILEVWIHNWTMLSDNPYQYSGINMFSLLG